MDRRIGLNDAQRRRFATVIVERTRPLKRYGPYDFYAVLLQASRLPEDQLKPIFDERQWRRMCSQFDHVRHYEKTVVAEGYLVETDAPDSP
jgi:hypothetical protein